MRFCPHWDNLPLLVFVHVPKTAGSSVNRFLMEHSRAGLAHAESLDRPGEKNAFNTSNYSWISAHLPYSRLNELLLGEVRSKSYFSVVRNPIDRLSSHINWNLAAVAKGPDFIQNHPEYDQEIILDIASTDFSNPFSVVAVLQKWKSHFSNLQASCIVGFSERWQEYDDLLVDNLIDDGLNKFNFIGHENNIGELEKSFGFSDDIRINSLFENKSPYFFDKNIFYHEIVRGYVDRLIKYDKKVYDRSIEKFVFSSPCSTRRCGDKLVNMNNFSEREYLRTNHDVLEAISSGIFMSGREHFERYGCDEGRRQRYCPLDCS